MGARTSSGLAGMLALSAGLLIGCGGGSSDSTPALSDAETLVGASLLPPDGTVASASVLGSNDLPPEAAIPAADSDLPPAT